MLKWMMTAFALWASAAAAEPVMLISIDGLRPADVIDAQARGVDAPNLSAFVSRGAFASGVVDVLPSVTYPNHTSLITGVSPARHGISNNVVFDPYGGNDLGWYWYASDIKVRTLWDAVHATGGVTASIGWPVSVGSDAIDYNIPEYWRARNLEDLKLLKALSTQGLVDELENATGVPFSALASEEVDADEARAKYAAALIAAKHPQFMTLHLVALDHFEHQAGPGSEKAKETLAALDRAIGALIADARKAEPDLIVAVVSDHGFAAIKQNTNLMIPFIEAGLVKYDPEKHAVASFDAIPWGAGGSAAIVLARPDDKKLRKQVKALLERLAADPALKIAQIIDSKEIAKRGGTPDASFWVDFTPGESAVGYKSEGPVVTPASGGTHGYFPSNPEMRSSFFITGETVPQGRNLGEIDMRAIAPTLAKRLGVEFKDAEKAPLF